MIDEDDDMNRRVRIIARTLVLNNLSSVSATMNWTHGEQAQLRTYPNEVRRMTLIGNDGITIRDAFEQLLNDITADLNHAGDSGFPTSSLELHIYATGAWEIEEGYTEERIGEDNYSAGGSVDLDHYDEEAA